MIKTTVSGIILAIILMFTNLSGAVSRNIPDNTATNQTVSSSASKAKTYTFRNESLYDSHYKKHGAEFGNITKDEYLKKANELINSESPDVLHKIEKEDGDYLFYNQKTNEFLVLSTDGYIRTYFKPDDGLDYWERQD